MVSYRLRFPWHAVARVLQTYDITKTVLFIYVLYFHVLLKGYRLLRARGFVGALLGSKAWATRIGTALAFRIPLIRKKIDLELAKVRVDLEAKLAPRGAGIVRHLAIPLEGRSRDWIAEEMGRMDNEGAHPHFWKDGKVSGAVYHGGDDIMEVIVDALKTFVVTNPLHPDIFPAVRRMDAEIVAMCLRMYNNASGAGTTTTGGTESILMACKTHRDWGRAVKFITKPEMIVPESAHAAFFKAASYFGITLHKIPVDQVTRKVDLRRVRRAINPNTVMLVGSAVNFGDGALDDIPALGQLAKRHNIGLHVDCCLGSFIMPFLEKAGFPLPHQFDFRVEGVTSISCDTHKYGFAPKGSSVVMYRDAELRKYQYFVMCDWQGGLYASPSMSGSRGGAVLAGTWAAMQYMGQDGYLASCRSIVSAAKTIEAAIRDDIPELYVLGKPPGPVVAFGSRDAKVNPLEVGDAMSSRGWHLNALTNPPGVHIACTRLTVSVVDQFIADLKDSVAEAKTKPAGTGTMVAVYGLGHSTAMGPALVNELAGVFLDTLYLA